MFQTGVCAFKLHRRGIRRLFVEMLRSSYMYGKQLSVQAECTPSRQKAPSVNLRSRREGTRWRPLQIWLLLSALWSAHVYLLSQHWDSRLCRARDAGAGPLWSEVDPSDYALGNCTFLVSPPFFFLSVCILSNHPLPARPPTIFFSFFSQFFEMRFEGSRWHLSVRAPLHGSALIWCK